MGVKVVLVGFIRVKTGIEQLFVVFLLFKLSHSELIIKDIEFKSIIYYENKY